MARSKTAVVDALLRGFKLCDACDGYTATQGSKLDGMEPSTILCRECRASYTHWWPEGVRETDWMHLSEEQKSKHFATWLELRRKGAL